MNGDEYRRITKALAREIKMSDVRAARIEQELVQAMAARDVASSPQSVWLRRKSFLWLPPVGGRMLLAAGALVVLIAASIALWRPNRGTIGTIPSAKPAAVENAPIPKQIAPPRPQHATVLPSARASQEVRSHRTAERTQSAGVVSRSGFVELPWSSGLPSFESGEIVRMELPLASLPVYGIDISSTASRGSVEADVLIGQDGFARAIRLVTNAAISTARSTQ
ncbi:MAG: hypothetical protein ACJ731_00570 [Vicinamibacterales bacterium]